MEEMREIFGRTLVELGREYKNIIVLDADLNTSTKTIYFAEEFPKRFIQLGIAEQNMMGWAAGIATTGDLIPFPVTFADFASKRTCDQVSISIAYPQVNVKIVGAYPGIPTGKAGATHQSVQDLANMRAMPNMRVVAPGDGQELRQVMRKAIEYYGPVYFRVPRCALPPLFGKNYQFEWGKGVMLKEGGDVTLIGNCIMSHKLLIAADILSKEGISARVLHLPSLKPIDEEIIVKAAKTTGALVTAENHSIIGGLGSAVAEVLSENSPALLKRIGIRDTFVETGEDEELFQKYGLSIQHIIGAAKELVRKK